MSKTKVFAKKIFKGVSWQHPIVNLILRLIDPCDYCVRVVCRRKNLPMYSIRVRSNGVTKQFGGKRFSRHGQYILNMLRDQAGLDSSSKVLEIGCGCGQAALALAQILDEGLYIGMDIERKSLDACRENKLLTNKKFQFDFLDVRNDEYNPAGKFSASTFAFPYPDSCFDVIFMISVITHMLPDDICNYVKEIRRMLKPDGHCLFSTFLVDYGRVFRGLSFPYQKDQYYYSNESVPEIAVGYKTDYFRREFAKRNMALAVEPLLGPWRGRSDIQCGSKYPQDVLVFCNTAQPENKR